jgi:hypothetical protein
MTAKRKLELTEAVDRWVKHSMILRACGIEPAPRTPLEELFQRLEREDAERESAETCRAA